MPVERMRREAEHDREHPADEDRADSVRDALRCAEARSPRRRREMRPEEQRGDRRTARARDRARPAFRSVRSNSTGRCHASEHPVEEHERDERRGDRPARMQAAGDRRAAAPSGSGRTERGHGRPSRISGGATIVSNTCWTMCTQKRRSAYVSTGESIATHDHEQPAVEADVAADACRAARRPSAYRTAATSSPTSGHSTDHLRGRTGRTR